MTHTLKWFAVFLCFMGAGGGGAGEGAHISPHISADSGSRTRALAHSQVARRRFCGGGRAAAVSAHLRGCGLPAREGGGAQRPEAGQRVAHRERQASEPNVGESGAPERHASAHMYKP